MAYTHKIVTSIIDELNVYFEHPVLKERRSFTTSFNDPDINFVYTIQRYSKGILIDFTNLHIDFENRGNGIMTSIFDELEMILLDLKKTNKEDIVVQIGNFNNQRLMKHFVTKRNYLAFKADNEIVFDQEKVDMYIDMYYLPFDMNRIGQMDELNAYIPNITKKII